MKTGTNSGFTRSNYKLLISFVFSAAFFIQTLLIELSLVGRHDCTFIVSESLLLFFVIVSGFFCDSEDEKCSGWERGERVGDTESERERDRETDRERGEGGQKGRQNRTEIERETEKEREKERQTNRQKTETGGLPKGRERWKKEIRKKCICL